MKLWHEACQGPRTVRLDPTQAGAQSKSLSAIRYRSSSARHRDGVSTFPISFLGSPLAVTKRTGTKLLGRLARQCGWDGVGFGSSQFPPPQLVDQERGLFEHQTEKFGGSVELPEHGSPARPRSRIDNRASRAHIFIGWIRPAACALRVWRTYQAGSGLLCPSERVSNAST
jgi:hypothetical protein